MTSNPNRHIIGAEDLVTGTQIADSPTLDMSRIVTVQRRNGDLWCHLSKNNWAAFERFAAQDLCDTGFPDVLCDY